jgi:hypothetical protein
MLILFLWKYVLLQWAREFLGKWKGLVEDGTRRERLRNNILSLSYKCFPSLRFLQTFNFTLHIMDTPWIRFIELRRRKAKKTWKLSRSLIATRGNVVWRSACRFWRHLLRLTNGWSNLQNENKLRKRQGIPCLKWWDRSRLMKKIIHVNCWRGLCMLWLCPWDINVESWALTFFTRT